MNLKISILCEYNADLANFYARSNSVFGTDLIFSELSLTESHKVSQTNTNVIIIDYDTIQLNSIEFIQSLKSRSIEVPIIIIATKIDEHVFNQLLNLNIFAYVEKDNVLNYVLANYLYDIKKLQENHAAS
ncbi:MAG: hypothetical protein U0T83_02760 [Bacteriovoracaceae bacterium]